MNQQSKLEDDIKEIYCIISTKNNSFHSLSLRWDRELLKCKKHKRKNGKYATIQKVNYNQFYDGVHPCQSLKEKWFNYLFYSMQKQHKLMHHQPYSSESDSETESWNKLIKYE